MLFGFSFLFFSFFREVLLIASVFFFFFFFENPDATQEGRELGRATQATRSPSRALCLGSYGFFFFFLLPSLICSAIVLGFCDNKGLKIVS